VDWLQFSELPPPDIYESLAVLDRIVAPTGPCNWPTISSTPRQGLTETQLMSSHSRRRLHGQPDLIACFYILDTQSGEMQRCTDDVEACLNERLVLLGKDNLPFEITHETLGASGSICCVPLYRQISIRISDALLGSATSLGHFIDHLWLPDTKHVLEHETSAQTLERCMATITHFQMCYAPARFKVGITASPLNRWRFGYADYSPSVFDEYERFILLHSAYSRGEVSMLESALIKHFEGDLGCMNFRHGGDGRLVGWPPYWVYVVVDSAGPPRRSGFYHART
jgi:hypothetical protein